jgi:hypothetical protein
MQHNSITKSTPFLCTIARLIRIKREKYKVHADSTHDSDTKY